MILRVKNKEAFWAGEFGDNYISRNEGKQLIASNTALFASVLDKTEYVSSLIEFGSNIGMNLMAIKNLQPDISLSAIEINQNAIKQLEKIGLVEIFPQSILDFSPPKSWDLVLIKGVLIHIEPARLPKVYDLLYQSSSRYICIAEYYNPTPVEAMYREHKGKLFKRDFAGECLDRFGDLRLVDYGFIYHRDNNFPQDDITWFLLEKTK